MIRIPRLALVAVLVIASVVFVASLLPSRSTDTEAFTAPQLPAMTASEALSDAWRLAPALLLTVYDAFGKTGEAEIYDTLALVAHGDALEALYLERVGAMAGGGLEEADQEIHEIKLVSLSTNRAGEALAMDATWQVIGTVGHAEHLHVRGNTYSADLAVAPAEGAWKITGFTLRDVSRDAAGEVFEAPPADREPTN